MKTLLNYCLFVLPLLFCHTARLQPTAAELPPPSGKYTVGMRQYEITDTSRTDLLHEGKKRRIPLTIYYPSSEMGKSQPYISNPQLLKQMIANAYNHQDSLALATMAGFHKHILPNAEAVVGMKFPVLVFSHGLGVSQWNYTSFFEEWASQGYVVVAIDHPYGGFTLFDDGEMATSRQDPRLADADKKTLLKIVEEWATDISFVIQTLTSPSSPIGKFATGLLDREKIIAVGHSLGGNAAVLASVRDSKIKAAVNMDGGTFDEKASAAYTKPVLTLRSQPVYSERELREKGRDVNQWRQMEAEIDAAFATEMSRAEKGYEIKIEGAGHMSFSDAPYVLPDMITRFGGKIIDRDKAFQLIKDAVGTFLNGVVSQQAVSFFPLMKEYSEVSIKKYSR